MTLVQLQNPAFVIRNWYTALLSILLVTIVTAFNIWGVKKLPLAETVFVILHVACFIIVLIVIAVTSPKNGAKEVFLVFSDNGGNYPLCMFSLCSYPQFPTQTVCLPLNPVESLLRRELRILT